MFTLIFGFGWFGLFSVTLLRSQILFTSTMICSLIDSLSQSCWSKITEYNLEFYGTHSCYTWMTFYSLPHKNFSAVRYLHFVSRIRLKISRAVLFLFLEIRDKGKNLWSFNSTLICWCFTILRMWAEYKCWRTVFNTRWSIWELYSGLLYWNSVTLSSD